MFWLSRPPYLRWAAAAAIFVGALAWDLRGTHTEPFPFAAIDIAPGEPIGSGAIHWKEAPAGLLPQPDPTAPYAARHIVAGEPITRSAVTAEAAIPEDWWSVELSLPASAVAGNRVRLVILEPPLLVDGIVVSGPTAGTFGSSDDGLVAVPEEQADIVGRAVAGGAVTVLLRP